jgi:hypothetical protein
MQSYIGTIITSIALLIALVSMWGVGKSIADKNMEGEKASIVFFVLSLIVFLVMMSLSIFYPNINSFCL